MYKLFTYICNFSVHYNPCNNLGEIQDFTEEETKARGSTPAEGHTAGGRGTGAV